MENKIAVIYNEAHVGHKPLTSSPENPERLTSIMGYLANDIKIFDGKCVLLDQFGPATEDEVFLVHQKRYVDFIKNYCKKGGGFLGDSTYLTRDSYKYALLAVGGAIKASEVVLEGRFDASFALIRPPGHHASPDSYGGYCIINNAAVLARYLQWNHGMKNIMIVDWDGHAADGTMKVFYEDPSVLTVSLHRDPVDFYPYSGFANQIGAKKGRGANINIALPKTSGDEEYFSAISEIVLPIYRQFSPDFVIGCNGFDAHFSDHNTKMRVTSEGFYGIVRGLSEEMEGKFTILMEGGYTDYNGKLAHSIISALQLKAPPYKSEIDVQSDSLFKEGKTHKIFESKLRELKALLSEFYKL
jgi:acetoin utilization deacetylase AcuC-like enzyme